MSYDVVRGSLAAQRSTRGDYADAVDRCVAERVAEAAVEDAALPQAGDGFLYLTRGVGADGHAGTYDTRSSSQLAGRDAAIAAAADACPDGGSPTAEP